MAEAMTAEIIIEAFWQLQGFWTKIRFPLQTEKGGWSDVDLIAYNPESKTLVISESKLQGEKDEIHVRNKGNRTKQGSPLVHHYLAFLDNLPLICKKDVVFKEFGSMVDTLIVQLVSNLYFCDDYYSEAKEEVAEKVKRLIPNGTKIVIRLDTHGEIICDIVKMERERGQGRRYGHPIIDLAREINRYLTPSIRDVGRGGLNIKEEFQKMFKESLNIGG